MKRALVILLSSLSVACQSPEPASSAASSVDDRQAVDVPTRLLEVRALVEGGSPFDALIALDEVQTVAGDDPEVWYVRGEAALAAANLGGNGARDLYVDARGAFERSAELAPGADAWLGASRAARMVGETAAALELARSALEAGTWERQPGERIVIEALFGSYVAKKQAEEDDPALFAETEERLGAYTQSRPDDPWGWTQLANLYQWQGNPSEALAAFEHVVELTPDDANAHQRYAQLARMDGGAEAVLAAYDAFNASHPDSPLGLWYSAVETFNEAVVDLTADRESIPGFQRAEELLVQCRTIEPSYEESCRGYEVMCRDGIGWALYGDGELERAKEAFLSMEDVLPGGLEWQLQGKLMSGVQGLAFIADRYYQRGENEFDPEGKPEAAAIFDILRVYKPEDPDYANNAGFFHRDACVAFEVQAQGFLRRAKGRMLVREGEKDEEADFDTRPIVEVDVEVTPEEAAEYEAQGQAMRALALEHAEKSYLAYKAAAENASDDVRVLNDAALVMVYHVRKDVPEMEALLERAIELGAEQVQDPDLSEEELDALLEAWGDAYQNMGLVYLTLKDDPAKAREYFEKAFEIGPRPRVSRFWVERYALPACDRALAGEADPLEGLDPRLWLHVHP